MRPESLLADRNPSSATISSVLVVDDSIEDALAITHLLRQNRVGLIRVITATNMLDALRLFRHERPDCVLLEHRLADGDGIELLHMLNEVTAPLPAPVIYLAGNDSPRLAVRALKAGALDYLAKSWLDSESLLNAVERAVEKVALSKARYDRQRATEDRNRDLQKSVQTLQESEQAKIQISGLAPTFLYVYDLLEDQIVYSNQTMLETIGYSEEELIEMGRGAIRQLVHPDDIPLYESRANRICRAADRQIVESEYRLKHKDGSWLWLHFRETVFLRDSNQQVWQVICTAENVTLQRESVATLRSHADTLELQVKDLKSVWDQDLIGIALTSPSKPRQLRLNTALSKMLGLPQDTDLGSFARIFGFTTATSPLGKALTKGAGTRNVERTIQLADGGEIRLLETIHPMTDQDGQTAGCIAYYVPTLGETGISARDSDDVWHGKYRQLQSALEVAEGSRAAAEARFAEQKVLAAEMRRQVDQKEQEIAQLRLQLEQVPIAPVVHLVAPPVSPVDDSRLIETETRWRETLTRLLASEEAKQSLVLKTEALESEVSRVSGELVVLERRYAASEVELRNHAAKVSEAEEQLREFSNSRLKEDGLREEILSLSQKLEVAEAAQVELAQLPEILAERESLLSQLERSKLASDARDSEGVYLRASMAGLEEERRTLKALLDDREADLAEQRVELEKLLAENDETGKMLANLQDHRGFSERRSEELEGERDSLLEDKSQLQAELEAVQMRDAVLEEEIAKIRTDRDLFEKQFGSLQQELGTAQTKLNEREERWIAATKNSAELVQQVEALKAALATAEGRLPDSAKDLQKMTIRLALLQAEFDGLHEAHEGLTSSHESLVVARDLLSAELSAKTAELLSLHETFSQLSVELEASRRSEAEAREQVAQLRDEARGLRSDLDSALRLKAQTEARLEERTRQFEEARAKVSQLEESLTMSEAERIEAQDKLIQSEANLRQVHQELRTAEEKYRSLAATLPCTIFTTTSLGTIEYENAIWKGFTGAPLREAQESGWKTVVHADDLDTIHHIWKTGLFECEPFSFTIRIRRNDGTYRWHDFRLTPETPDGHVRRWLGTALEIHEQVISRESARQARLRYGALLDNTKECVLFLSPNGFVLGASRTSLGLLRQGSEAVVGQAFWETRWWPKAERPKLEDAVRRAAAGDIVEVDTQRVDLDGQAKAARIQVVPIKDENGLVAMLVPYFSDL